MQRIVNLIVLPGAVILRNDNAGTARKAQKEPDEHIDNRSNRADSRKGFVADKVADDPGIDRVIELLKQVPGKQRQRKPDKMCHDAAFGHIRTGIQAGEFIFDM